MDDSAGLPPEDPELTRLKVAWLWETGGARHGSCHVRGDGRVLADVDPGLRGPDERDTEGRLVTHPVAVGTGEALFKGLSSPLRLRLVESRAIETAAVHVYRAG